MTRALRWMLWECPECGSVYTENYRHLHSTDTPPYSERVHLVGHTVAPVGPFTRLFLYLKERLER